MKKNNFRKRIKGLMYVFMVLFISLVGLKNTSAEEVNLHWNRYYNTYYAYTVLDGASRYFYLKTYDFNGKLAYCIELGKDIPNEVYSYSSDFSSLGYSQEQIDYISLVAYYGYEYPTHKDNLYYFMAAQEMIWEYLSGVEVQWTPEKLLSPSDEYTAKYIDEINNLIERHKTLPSFVSDDNYYLLSDNISLVDLNGVLSDYEIIDSNGLDIENKDNILNIKNADSGDYKIRLKRRGYLNNSTLIYYNDVSQKLFSVGDINNDEIIVRIHIKGANLKVYKYDSYTMSNVVYANGLLLSGAKYRLYDSNDNVIGEFITDENGSFVISNLSIGKYYIKEMEASYGYELDDNVYEINIDKEDSELIVYEKPIIKRLEINKTYGDDYSPEENITFDIIDSNGSKYGSITTDSNGYGYIEIPLGSYIIRQVNSKDGYMFNDDILIDITATSEDIITYNLQDDKIKEESNPHTYDGIKGNIIMSVMSIFSLISILIFYFKFGKEK